MESSILSLTLEQIEYAALDAWTGLKVFKAMEQRGLISSDIIDDERDETATIHTID